ncbi:MAG: DUF5696 domain-containing protein [Oscillospiraceae bacterium]|nr:DUF5696 domain-containing protein [Oscillospiraceae bacterium]
MRKLLLTALSLLSLLFLLILAACSSSVDDEEGIRVRGFDAGEAPQVYEFENESLLLSFHPHTTHFSLLDKNTGVVWESNPQEDLGATGLTDRIMKSLLVLSYSEKNGVTSTLDSFRYSVDKELYEYEVFDNGFEIHFTIGDIERIFYIPEAIPEWRMDQLTADMTPEEVRQIPNLFYRIYSPSMTVPSGETMASIRERFPDLDETRVYALRDIGAHLKAQAEDLFEKYGYTMDDYRDDLEFYGEEREVTAPVFNITLRVELDGESLKVSVPYDEIEYRTEFPPVGLSVLPYFGAGHLDDEGYMLVPDGAGALINFNNGKGNQNPYFNRVYGWDEAISREAMINDNKAHYPVFGIEKNENAMLCIIEQGAAYASVRADVSGALIRNSNYNNVFAEYSLIHSENLEIAAKSNTAVLLFERDLAEGESLVQSYYFPKNNGYMGMAEKYREYLIERHPHLALSDTSSVPVAVEIVGAVNRVQHVLGIPVDRSFGLTTYNQASDIVNDLSRRGFDDVHYRLTGWFNSSLQHTVPTKVKLISGLGNKRGLTNLVSTVNNNNSQIYMEANFLYMYDTSPFDGFSLNRDAARYVNRKRVQAYPHSFVSFGPKTWYEGFYLARPDFMMSTIDSFIGSIGSYGAENIAFRTIGNNLAGDYNEKRKISREASMNTQIDKLAELRAKGNSIMLQSGYAYAAPYADFITDFPLGWQGFGILDVEIPFYQIVLHGLVPYAGRPINLAEDYDMNILRSLETGSGLYFHFMHENPLVLQDSRYLEFFSSQYSMWAETAEELLDFFDTQIGDTYNQYITDYIALAEGVSVTEYANGVKVIVNRSGVPHVYEGKVINSMDFTVIRGGR